MLSQVDAIGSARRCRRLPRYDGNAAGALAGAEALLEGLASASQPASSDVAPGYTTVPPGGSLDDVAPGTPVLRWYTVRPPALFLGASQKPEAADLAACRAAGIPVYKRAAGGTVVLADDDMLGLDVALPRDDPLLLPDLTRSYRWLGEVWTAALRALGVDAVLVSVEEAQANQREASDEARVARLACFGALSPFEVTVEGRKIVGLAQVRRRHGALFQSALLLRWAPERLSRLLAVPASERYALAAALAARTVGLDTVAAQPISTTAIIGAVEAALAAHGLVLVDADWTAEEESLAARLLSERYQPVA